MRKRYTKEEIAKMPRHIDCAASGCGNTIQEGELYYDTEEGHPVCSKHFSQGSAEGQMVFRHVFNKKPPISGFIHDGKIEPS